MKLIQSVQFSSVAQSYLTLCDPQNRSSPGFPVFHCPLEFAQTHVHWVSNAIQPSHSLSSRSPPTFDLSQHQVFSNELALRIRWPKYWNFSLAPALPMNIQGWFPLGLAGLILLSRRLSRVFSSSGVWKHQFSGTQPSLWPIPHIHAWLLGKP